MILIAAVDNNWAIGLRGELLVRIPADQKYFRSKTIGHTVVMGRKTLESFPGGQPLIKRRNIVLTTDAGYCVKGVETSGSLKELDELLAGTKEDEIFCIGGGSVYRELLDRCDTAYITKIDKSFEADTFIPDLDKAPEWELVEESEEQTYFDLIYYFRTYRRSTK
ncbi:MAG: dihydrofolate reductase [Lachnospiraceae bacterium]|nr:dihydrofolate reductase [Lachnospiraceae bacterium]